MADDAIVVLVHEAGTADARGVPAVLTHERAVVVPSPPPRLLDRDAELEVVIVPTPLPETSGPFPVRAVERIRVVEATEFAGVGVTALLLGLERSSSHPARDVGDAGGSLDALTEHDGDLWAAMRAADPTVEDRLRAADAELLGRLPAIEHAQRVPSWETVPATGGPDTGLGDGPGDGLGPIKMARGWWCYIWRCR